MQHLDEGMIHAWLDGELSPAEREAAEAHLATCDECKAAVAEARGFVAASSRILTALDAVPGGVLPASSKSSVGGGERAPARFRVSRAWMAAAAVLVLSTATIIVIRPRGETSAMRVADASTEAKATEMTPTAALKPEALARTAPSSTAATPVRVPAAPTADRPALTGKITDKKSSREFAERKDERKKTAESATFSVDAADTVTKRAAGAGATTSDAMAKAAPPPPVGEATPSVAQAPHPATGPADSLAKGQSLRMGQVVVTGQGVMSATEKLDAQPDTATVRIVSRSTSSFQGDTVVTTEYNVRGARIVLIDRSTSRTETRRAANGVAQYPWKPGNVAAPMNSITWSDSTGRTRTLRGPVSRAELERIRAELFGATP
ncbi:MAG: zf-HC2 domain-containing protein [Gemmatimonadaceae bacterium]